MSYFYSFISAMLVSLLLIPALRKYAATLGLLDEPDERKVHKGVVPRVGGIAMVAGMLVSVLFWIDLEPYVYAYIMAVIVIAIFGTWDDKVQLGHKSKFIGQLIASLIVIFVGDVKVNSLPFLYDGIIPDFISIPFTLFALLGITNAINLSDGLDGLAGGTSLFSLGVIALLGFQAGDTGFVLLCLAIVGSILGFLRFNSYPAVIFMGDTGSQFLGFSLGVLVIWLSQKVLMVMSPAIAIIILGLPLLDTFYVMTNRMLKGSSPFKPDKTHIHHKLLTAGMHHYEAVVCIYLIQSTLVISAYFFRYHNDFLILSVFIIASLLLIFLIEQLGRNNFLKKNKDRVSVLNRFIDERGNRNRLTVFVAMTSLVLVVIYFSSVFLLAESTPTNLLVISCLIIIMMIYSLFNTNSLSELPVLRMAMYLTGTMAIYLAHLNAGVFFDKAVYINGLFICLLLATLLGLIFPEKGKESITPLDYIIVFILLVLTMLPADEFVDVSNYATDISRLFILFYLTEFILMSVRKYFYLLKSAVFVLQGMMLFKILF